MHPTRDKFGEMPLKFNKLIKNSVRKFARLSSALVIGLAIFGKASFAGNCDGYLVVTGGSFCGCTDSVSGGSTYSFGNWTELTGTGSPYGMPASASKTHTDVCADSVTTTCSSTITALSIGLMTPGRILYVKNVSSGATDYFKCTWQASGGFSISSAYTPMPLSSAPTTLTATVASATQINLAWADTSSDETGFKVESPAGTVITTTSQDATTYSHTGLTCGTTYNYAVKAININNADSAPATASATTSTCPGAPTAPTGLTATVASATQIDLSWTDNSSDETGFKVESPAGTAITTTAVNISTYGRTGLTCNTNYTFAVKATNANGDSTSITANATTSACPGGGSGGSGGTVSAPIFSLKDKPAIFSEEVK